MWFCWDEGGKGNSQNFWKFWCFVLLRQDSLFPKDWCMTVFYYLGSTSIVRLQGALSNILSNSDSILPEIIRQDLPVKELNQLNQFSFVSWYSLTWAIWWVVCPLSWQLQKPLWRDFPRGQQRMCNKGLKVLNLVRSSISSGHGNPMKQIPGLWRTCVWVAQMLRWTTAMLKSKFFTGDNWFSFLS